MSNPSQKTSYNSGPSNHPNLSQQQRVGASSSKATVRSESPQPPSLYDTSTSTTDSHHHHHQRRQKEQTSQSFKASASPSQTQISNNNRNNDCNNGSMRTPPNYDRPVSRGRTHPNPSSYTVGTTQTVTGGNGGVYRIAVTTNSHNSKSPSHNNNSSQPQSKSPAHRQLAAATTTMTNRKGNNSQAQQSSTHSSRRHASPSPNRVPLQSPSGSTRNGNNNSLSTYQMGHGNVASAARRVVSYQQQQQGQKSSPPRNHHSLQPGCAVVAASHLVSSSRSPRGGGGDGGGVRTTNINSASQQQLQQRRTSGRMHSPEPRAVVQRWVQPGSPTMTTTAHRRRRPEPVSDHRTRRVLEDVDDDVNDIGVKSNNEYNPYEDAQDDEEVVRSPRLGITSSPLTDHRQWQKSQQQHQLQQSSLPRYAQSDPGGPTLPTPAMYRRNGNTPTAAASKTAATVATLTAAAIKATAAEAAAAQQQQREAEAIPSSRTPKGMASSSITPSHNNKSTTAAELDRFKAFMNRFADYDPRAHNRRNGALADRVETAGSTSNSSRHHPRGTQIKGKALGTNEQQEQGYVDGDCFDDDNDNADECGPGSIRPQSSRSAVVANHSAGATNHHHHHGAAQVSSSPSPSYNGTEEKKQEDNARAPHHRSSSSSSGNYHNNNNSGSERSERSHSNHTTGTAPFDEPRHESSSNHRRVTQERPNNDSLRHHNDHGREGRSRSQSRTRDLAQRFEPPKKKESTTRRGRLNWTTTNPDPLTMTDDINDSSSNHRRQGRSRPISPQKRTDANGTNGDDTKGLITVADDYITPSQQQQQQRPKSLPPVRRRGRPWQPPAMMAQTNGAIAKKKKPIQDLSEAEVNSEKNKLVDSTSEQPLYVERSIIETPQPARVQDLKQKLWDPKSHRLLVAVKPSLRDTDRSDGSDGNLAISAGSAGIRSPMSRYSTYSHCNYQPRTPQSRGSGTSQFPASSPKADRRSKSPAEEAGTRDRNNSNMSTVRSVSPSHRRPGAMMSLVSPSSHASSHHFNYLSSQSGYASNHSDADSGTGLPTPKASSSSNNNSKLFQSKFYEAAQRGMNSPARSRSTVATHEKANASSIQGRAVTDLSESYRGAVEDIAAGIAAMATRTQAAASLPHAPSGTTVTTTKSEATSVAHLMARLAKVNRENPDAALAEIDAILRAESNSAAGASGNGSAAPCTALSNAGVGRENSKPLVVSSQDGPSESMQHALAGNDNRKAGGTESRVERASSSTLIARASSSNIKAISDRWMGEFPEVEDNKKALSPSNGTANAAIFDNEDEEEDDDGSSEESTVSSITNPTYQSARGVAQAEVKPSTSQPASDGSQSHSRRQSNNTKTAGGTSGSLSETHGTPYTRLPSTAADHVGEGEEAPTPDAVGSMTRQDNAAVSTVVQESAEPEKAEEKLQTPKASQNRALHVESTMGMAALASEKIQSPTKLALDDAIARFRLGSTSAERRNLADSNVNVVDSGVLKSPSSPVIAASWSQDRKPAFGSPTAKAQTQTRSSPSWSNEQAATSPLSKHSTEQSIGEPSTAPKARLSVLGGAPVEASSPSDEPNSDDEEPFNETSRVFPTHSAADLAQKIRKWDELVKSPAGPLNLPGPVADKSEPSAIKLDQIRRSHPWEETIPVSTGKIDVRDTSMESGFGAGVEAQYRPKEGDQGVLIKERSKLVPTRRTAAKKVAEEFPDDEARGSAPKTTKLRMEVKPQVNKEKAFGRWDIDSKVPDQTLSGSMTDDFDSSWVDVSSNSMFKSGFGSQETGIVDPIIGSDRRQKLISRGNEVFRNKQEDHESSSPVDERKRMEPRPGLGSTDAKADGRTKQDFDDELSESDAQESVGGIEVSLLDEGPETPYVGLDESPSSDEGTDHVEAQPIDSKPSEGSTKKRGLRGLLKRKGPNSREMLNADLASQSSGSRRSRTPFRSRPFAPIEQDNGSSELPLDLRNRSRIESSSTSSNNNNNNVQNSSSINSTSSNNNDNANNSSKTSNRRAKSLDERRIAGNPRIAQKFSRLLRVYDEKESKGFF